MQPDPDGGRMKVKFGGLTEVLCREKRRRRRRLNIVFIINAALCRHVQLLSSCGLLETRTFDFVGLVWGAFWGRGFILTVPGTASRHEASETEAPSYKTSGGSVSQRTVIK